MKINWILICTAAFFGATGSATALSEEGGYECVVNIDKASDDADVAGQIQFAHCVSDIILESAVEQYASGEKAVAEALFLALLEKAETPRDDAIIETAWGDAAFKSGALDSAKEKYSNALRRLADVEDADSPLIARILDGLVGIAEASGDTAEAERLRKLSQEMSAYSTRTSSWNGAIQEGTAALEAKDYGRAIDGFKSAYEFADAPDQQITIRINHAYATALAGNMGDADKILVDAVEIANLYEIEDKNLLVSLFDFAGNIAIELGDRSRAGELWLAATKNRPYDEKVWNQNDAGGYTHLISGVTFPIELAGMRRSKIMSFDDSGRDVAGEYNKYTEGGKIWITTYVTATDHYGDENGEPLTKDAYFKTAKNDISMSFSDLDIAEDGILEVEKRSDLHPRFTMYRGMIGSPPADHMTGILVEEIAGYFIKMRVSYRAEMGYEGRVAFESFLADFDWPEALSQP